LVEVLLLDKKTFDEMVRFVMKAMREGILEDEIWATLEVMSRALEYMHTAYDKLTICICICGMSRTIEILKIRI
jgi:hypothetical protein